MHSYFELIQNPVFVITLVVISIVKVIPPRKINSWYGYRTKMSMKNQKNWDYAQKYSTTRILYVTLVAFIVELVTVTNYGTGLLITMGIFMLWLLGVLFVVQVTERKLGKL